eukprot:GHUV01023443.1.p1 GENE.GHUV01023443.1~~GHUV01023443.1.p1  ORF type:complete len:447 (+),score=96.43 GHUV01023443.1:244-1584(+)
MSSDGPEAYPNSHDQLKGMASVAYTPADAALPTTARTLGPEATISSPASASGTQSFVEGLKYGAAGGVAGAFAKSCTAPLARLTILYQVQGFSAGQPGAVQQPPRLRHAFLQVVRREGPAALWKGNLATILHRLPYSSINFYTYEHTNRFLVKQLPPNTDFARSLASGALAGLVACTAAYPLDLVRTRLAAQTQGNYYHGILPTLQRIVADEGAVGLYRGLGATLLQVVPSLALSFSLYDTIRDSCMNVYVKQQRQQHNTQQLEQQDPQDLQAAASSQSIDNSNSSRKRRRSLLGSPSNPQELAHSLSVASSVDQGTSLAQAAIWHMADQDAQAASRSRHQQASSSSVQRAAAVGTSAVGDPYGDLRASDAATDRSSNSSNSSSSSHSSRARGGGWHAEVPAGISLASGCISGFITATVTFPLDVIRRRMQVGSALVRQWPVGMSA